MFNRPILRKILSRHRTSGSTSPRAGLRRVCRGEYCARSRLPRDYRYIWHRGFHNVIFSCWPFLTPSMVPVSSEAFICLGFAKLIIVRFLSAQNDFILALSNPGRRDAAVNGMTRNVKLQAGFILNAPFGFPIWWAVPTRVHPSRTRTRCRTRNGPDQGSAHNAQSRVTLTKKCPNPRVTYCVP